MTSQIIKNRIPDQEIQQLQSVTENLATDTYNTDRILPINNNINQQISKQTKKDSLNRFSINVVETATQFEGSPQQSNSLLIPMSNIQSTPSVSQLLDQSNDKTNSLRGSILQCRKNLSDKRPSNYIGASPRGQEFVQIDLKNPEHQEKNRPKNSYETDMLSGVIQNLPFFKSNKEVLSLSSTTKELLQSLKLEYVPKNEIIFSKGSCYCLLELYKQEQNSKIKEEGNRKKAQFNLDLSTNPTFEQEQAALKQTFPNMNLVKIFQSGESFGEIALITSQPRTATLIVRQNAYFMTLSKEAYNKIMGQYDQIILRDRRKFLMNFSCFKYHTYSKLLSLLHFMKIQIVSKKVKVFESHVLYKEGDSPDFIYFIKQGEVEISKTCNLDDELEKDNSVELYEWRNQRKTQIYKLNKVKQMKDKIESILRIQVVILGQNNCFGEEDIFLEQTKRKSSAIVVSSSAEIFQIEKQKLLNDLNISQTLDAFIKEFHLKYKQQQINHQKNINSAVSNRKALILENCAKKSKQQISSLAQVIPSAQQQQLINFPKLSAKKNLSLVQQAFGGNISHRETLEDEDTSKNNVDSNLAPYHFNTLETRHPNINLSFNSRMPFNYPKDSYSLPNESYNHQNHKSQYLLKRKETSKAYLMTEPTYNIDQESQYTNQGNVQSLKKIQLTSNLDFVKANSQRNIAAKNDFFYKNSNFSVTENNSPKNEDFYSTSIDGVTAKSLDYSHKNDHNPDFIFEGASPKSQTSSKKLKLINMIRNKTSLPAIRKEDGKQKESTIDKLDKIDQIYYENQLQLIDLNTRSLDLKEISSELLKIYIQKHSQQQVKQSLSNIAQSRLLSMSTTLRDSYNNRLYMKYQGLFDRKKTENSDIKFRSTTNSQQLIQPENQTIGQQSPKSSLNQSNDNSSFLQRRPKNLSVNVKPLKQLTPSKDDAYIKPNLSRAQSDYFQTVQNSPKSTASYFKAVKKNDSQQEIPMSTTMQYKYFKQQVDFLQNSEKYIENIKKSNNTQLKLCDILTQNNNLNETTPSTSKQINQKYSQQAINDSLSLLTQEMFKGSASSIKDIKLQRHHSLIMAGAITSPSDSPKSTQLNLVSRKQSNVEGQLFQNSLRSFQEQQSAGFQKQDDDGFSEECKQISDSINEGDLNTSIISPKRSRELSGFQMFERKQSSFSKNSDNILQQQQSQQSIQIIPSLQIQITPQPSNSLVQKLPLLLSPPKNGQSEELKKTPKGSSSFKIEYIQQSIEPSKNQTSIQNTNDKSKIKQDLNFLCNFKNMSNPQLTKLVCHIEEMKKEKEEDMHYLSRSICKSELNKISDEPQSKFNPPLPAEKYKNNFSNLKGDQQHYKKIKELNHLQNSIFKQAKLCDRNSYQTQSNKILSSQQQAISNIFLNVQPKQIIKQKENNS